MLNYVACGNGIYEDRIKTSKAKGGDVMFSDNLKSIRKAKGFTQEELATKINVVRQTVSKWEKGLSVPDADVLSNIAEVLEVNVSELLGFNIKQEDDNNEIAVQLAKISEQLAIKNRRTKKVLKTIATILVSIVLICIVFVIAAFVLFSVVTSEGTAALTILRV